jgi:hypothetical protein
MMRVIRIFIFMPWERMKPGWIFFCGRKSAALVSNTYQLVKGYEMIEDINLSYFQEPADF